MTTNHRLLFIGLFLTALLTILCSHPLFREAESGMMDEWNLKFKQQQAALHPKEMTLVIAESSLNASRYGTRSWSPGTMEESSLNATTLYSTPRSMVASSWREIKSVMGLAGLIQMANTMGRAQQHVPRAGLVNFNRDEEVHEWVELAGQRPVVFGLEPASEGVRWKDLYPEWIDEEEKYGKQRCPVLPMPRVQGIEDGWGGDGDKTLDMVVAKLPCSIESNRDVARLHVQLAAAQVAVTTGASHVLLLDSCSSTRNDRHRHRPLPNLFACDRLIAARGPAWLFHPNLPSLETHLSLPVGSCRLANLPPTLQRLDRNTGDKKKKKFGGNGGLRREAYATILHSAETYVCGAIAVARSIRLTRSNRDLVILVDENISPQHRRALKAAGWTVMAVKRIRNPMARRGAYNEWNYSKFRLWQLTMYDKIIFVDADLLVLRNIDFLFDLPEISATGNNASLFNSGVMVIEPKLCTFELLMESIDDIVSYNGGDQGFLNEVFPYWHRISKKTNYLKYFWANESEEDHKEKTRLFGADPPELFVLHYLGLKPWMCFRDYDCNWNVGYMRKYASDVAHSVWWKVHDTMSPQLQQLCLLSTKQKASLQWQMMKAKNASFPDGHWRRKISDPRLQICREKICDWKDKLRHWGKG